MIKQIDLSRFKGPTGTTGAASYLTPAAAKPSPAAVGRTSVDTPQPEEQEHLWETQRRETLSNPS